MTVFGSNGVFLVLAFVAAFFIKEKKVGKLLNKKRRNSTAGGHNISLLSV